MLLSQDSEEMVSPPLVRRGREYANQFFKYTPGRKRKTIPLPHYLAAVAVSILHWEASRPFRQAHSSMLAARPDSRVG